MSHQGVSRRHALGGAATVGLGLPLLAACGGDEPAGAPDPEPTTADSSPEESGGSGPEVLASTSDVAVGEGLILAEHKVVLTQPTEGEFLGFSTTCTHQGCAVSTVVDGTINCPCHGSQFSIEDGSVQAGPAPGPLAPVALTVKGDRILRG